MSIAKGGHAFLAIVATSMLSINTFASTSTLDATADNAHNGIANQLNIAQNLVAYRSAAMQKLRSIPNAAKEKHSIPNAQKTVAARQKLRSARIAIKHGNNKQLSRLKQELKNHPLLPYIDYWALSKKLSSLPYKEIDQFLNEYQNTAIGNWLRLELLRELGRRERFRAYLKYYRPQQITRITLRCYYADALIHHGNKQHANALIRELWSVGNSQAKACDPAFKRWMADGGLTAKLAWQRHRLALAANNLQLAKYITSKMSPSQAKLARLMQSVYRNPLQLMQFERFINQNAQYRDIIFFGLQRLASKSAEQATQAWERYSASYFFNDKERDNFLRHLALQLAIQDNQEGLRIFFSQNSDFFDQRTTEWLIRQSLRELNWAQVALWINRLPEDVQSQDRWLYWQARAIDAQEGNRRTKTAQRLYQRAANGRSYYGFLAADTIGQHYSFSDRPVPITSGQVKQMAAHTGLRRAQELKAIGELYHAQREWNYATAAMNSTELMTASKLASTWGWHQKSIQSILAAGYLDDLKLRFPLGFPHIIDQVVDGMGNKSALDSYLIYAVTRQESHFRHDAKSGSGALGLMQLLPSTAQITARRNGVSYRHNWDLLTPKTNITLGTLYLNALLRRFDNNRFLAAAAYNAGPTRVSGWLKQTKKQLPQDVWIETIPFRETRNYVQQVLSYRVIYAYRSGTQTSLLRANETRGKY